MFWYKNKKFYKLFIDTLSSVKIILSLNIVRGWYISFPCWSPLSTVCGQNRMVLGSPNSRAEEVEIRAIGRTTDLLATLGQLTRSWRHGPTQCGRAWTEDAEAGLPLRRNAKNGKTNVMIKCRWQFEMTMKKGKTTDVSMWDICYSVSAKFVIPWSHWLLRGLPRDSANSHKRSWIRGITAVAPRIC